MLAPGFTVEPLEPNSIDNRLVRLRRNGVLKAVMFPGSPGHDHVADLSQLIAIGLDTLERSILDLDGAPALATR